MKVTVKRSEWRRGIGLNGNALAKYRPIPRKPTFNLLTGSLPHPEVPPLEYEFQGRCCLGFACQQLGGFTDEEMKNVPWPYGMALSEVSPELDKLFVMHNTTRAGSKNNSPFAGEAGRINDATDISEETRERELTALFNKHGVSLSFVD